MIEVKISKKVTEHYSVLKGIDLIIPETNCDDRRG